MIRSLSLPSVTAALGAALLAAFAAGQALAADPVFPPGSRIGMVPPADMTPVKGMPGFRNLKTGQAIIAIEMPVEAYPSLAAGFTDEALKAQGFDVKLKENPKIGSGTALLVTGMQNEGGQQAVKTVLLAADPTLTVLVIGQSPGNTPQAEIAKVEAAIRTTAIRPPVSMKDQIASLPFRIKDEAGFRPIRAMAGNSILLTDGPLDVIREAEQPMVIVAQSFGNAPPPDQRDAFAKTALVGNSFVKDPILERAQSFRQDGSEWHEIIARAKDGASGNPVVVSQTIRWEADGYVRTLGVVRSDQRDLMLPRFRKVADSVVVK